jgi:hypothetical protein
MKYLVVHEAAEPKLWAEVAYYENEAEGLGLDMLLEVEAAFRRIQEHPGRCSPPDMGRIVFFCIVFRTRFSTGNFRILFG